MHYFMPNLHFKLVRWFSFQFRCSSTIMSNELIQDGEEIIT